MSDNKQQKKYYALNLTEGRIWVIFILTVVLIAIISLIVVIVLKNNSNKDNNSLISSTVNSSSAYFDYHKELGVEESIINPENKTDTAKQDATSDSLKAEIIENKNDAVIAENKVKKVEDEVKLDNSDVVYSSKYKDNKSVNNTNNTDNISKNQTKKQTASTQIKNSKRYAVQVGSYEEKNFAEKVSIYYNMQGYPTYIEEKNKNGKRYYRLRVGPFKEKNKAQEYLVSLKATKYGQNSMLWEFNM